MADSPWKHPEPNKAILRPDTLEGPDVEEITDEELEKEIATRVRPRHKDNRGMSPSLGGERGQ